MAVCPDGREAGAVSGRPDHLESRPRQPFYQSHLHGALTEQGGANPQGSSRRAFDNIFTERLWQSVQYEEVYWHDDLSPREARLGLDRYFPLYNNERPHQALVHIGVNA